MKRLLIAASALLGLAAFGFLVAMFVFGYIAALRPGRQTDPESDAALVSLFGALIFGGLSLVAGYISGFLDQPEVGQ